MLPDEYEFRNSNGWLTAIEFGKEEQERKAKLEAEEFERKAKTRLLRANGINMSHEEMLEWEKIPPEERKAMREGWNKKQRAASFPVHSSVNPDRRADKTKQRYADAPKKTSEKRQRTVRTSRSTIDPKPYLSAQYTNDDEQLVCQMCELEMPFKLRDGNYYFEAVQLSDDAKKETHQVYLALCPICAAKYKKLVKTHSTCLGSFIAAILDADDEELSFSIDMQESSVESVNIRFTETHLLDVQSVLGEEVDG